MYCPSCGENIVDDAQYCRHCGEGIPDQDIATHQVEAPNRAAESNDRAESESTRHTHFYIGAVLATFAVVLAPYVFFLVALPEALLRIGDSSIQDQLGEYGRDNPFVSGSLLIMHWFGNFIILLLVLGLIVGALYLV